MKKFKTTIYLMMMISVAITAIMLQFLPETIPAHYNIAGEIDRLGSKYESIIFPAVTIAMGIFFLFVDRLVPRAKNEKERKTENAVIFVSGVLTMLYFIGMNIFFMGKGITYGNSGTASVPGIDPARFNSIAVIMLGVLLLVLGNYMPKARVNAIFGLRTKWSMANDRVWQKSQRFGGIASVICGFSLMVMAVFARKWVILWTLVVLLIWSAAAITASYIYYRKDRMMH